MSRLPQIGGDDGNWGAILNDFLSQAHNADGSLKPLVSPAFSGTPTAPTAAAGTNTTQLATTAFVATAAAAKMPKSVQLIDGQNLNTLTEAGFYEGSSFTNAPSGQTSGFVLVAGTGSYTSQIFQINGGDHFWHRSSNGGIWSGWRELLGAASPTLTGTIQLGNADTDILKVRALEVDTDQRSTSVTYNGDGTVHQVIVKSGSTTVKTTTINYNGDGTPSTVVSVGGGVTVTKTLSYDGSGNYTGTTKSVA